jgi:2',3'-cyclic-nucleotide 2'-phosphodiesterase (5'-nucleotidase family)
MISSFGEEVASSLGIDDVVATIGDGGGRGGSSSSSTTANAATTPRLPRRPLDTRMSSVRRREATGGNLVADAMRWMLETGVARAGGGGGGAAAKRVPTTTLAMINGGFIRGDRLYGPGSDITVRDVLRELPFPRTMTALEISGKHLREALGQQLRGSSGGRPTGAFPHLSSNASLRYGIIMGDDGSSSADDEAEVRSLTVDGTEVTDERKYVIAVTSFVADGSEGCTSWTRGVRVQNPSWDGVNMACVLLKYLRHHRDIHPVLEGRVVLQKNGVN